MSMDTGAGRAHTGMRIAALLAVLLVGGAGYLFWPRPAAVPVVAPGAGTSDPPPVPVLLATAETAPAEDTFRAVGTLLADESVVIRAEIAGRIARLDIAEGAAVEQGRVLARIADEEWTAVLRQNEATLALQELKMKRVEELRAKNVVSQQDHDETVAALDQARAALALARARLDKTVIRAPFGGILGLRRVSPGDYLQAGQELVNLESIDPLKVDFSVPERFAVQLAPGKTVNVRINAFPDESFRGEVYAIDPRIDAATRSFLLRARINNPEGRLRPGMFADAELVLAVRADALWIPEQAIVPIGERQFVYQVRDGTAYLTPVRTGLRKPGLVEIVAGLEAGAVVVSEGQQKLQDGAGVVAAPLLSNGN
ncbi:MAG: efflux RND transporter periplasmic adaptor subunit [Gammaproteobacteria bacterium]|nr:efflux RND transporter periplasmic adaptor subunit [Gammaproteobacteria bacterium]